MASINEILELVRAGYTRDEIAALTGDAATAAPPESSAAPEQEAPAAPPESSASPEQEAPAWAVALQQTLTDLRSTIQSANRAHDEMGDEFTAADAAESALAEYITGSKQNKKGGK